MADNSPVPCFSAEPRDYKSWKMRIRRHAMRQGCGEALHKSFARKLPASAWGTTTTDNANADQIEARIAMNYNAVQLLDEAFGENDTLCSFIRCSMTNLWPDGLAWFVVEMMDRVFIQAANVATATHSMTQEIAAFTMKEEEHPSEVIKKLLLLQMKYSTATADGTFASLVTDELLVETLLTQAPAMYQQSLSELKSTSTTPLTLQTFEHFMVSVFNKKSTSDMPHSTTNRDSPDIAVLASAPGTSSNACVYDPRQKPPPFADLPIPAAVADFAGDATMPVLTQDLLAIAHQMAVAETAAAVNAAAAAASSSPSVEALDVHSMPVVESAAVVSAAVTPPPVEAATAAPADHLMPAAVVDYLYTGDAVVPVLTQDLLAIAYQIAAAEGAKAADDDNNKDQVREPYHGSPEKYYNLIPKPQANKRRGQDNNETPPKKRQLCDNENQSKKALNREVRRKRRAIIYMKKSAKLQRTVFAKR